jgi:hypothetical protein
VQLGQATWHSTHCRRPGCSAVGIARRSHCGIIFGEGGTRWEAREVMNTLEAVSRERCVPPYAMALTYGGLGEHDQAWTGSIAPTMRTTFILC